MKDEGSYICESCGEEIVVPIDLSAGAEQEYVEDCLASETCYHFVWSFASP
jgi:Cysteine-rich CPXCG